MLIKILFRFIKKHLSIYLYFVFFFFSQAQIETEQYERGFLEDQIKHHDQKMKELGTL